MSQLRGDVYGVCLSLALTVLLIHSEFAFGASSNRPTEMSNVNKAAVTAAFRSTGQKEGLEIWRVEKFSPVPVKSVDFGKFHEGDCYLLLKTKDSRGKKSYDIFYWIGKDSSQDESGSVAIMAVELDNALGGSPVQYRETQEHESQKFLANFPSGVRYLPGGVSSGFHHVNPNAPDSTKKLYQVKGKKHIRVKLIEPKASAMNKGDSFILDNGKTIYVYYGVNSQRTERLKAISAANQIRDQDHSGRAKVEIIDENSSPEETADFFQQLGGGSRASLRDASAGGDDTEFERNYDAQVVLYKVSDSSGSLKIDKVAEKPLSKVALNTNDAFILDTVTSGIYAWIGRKSNKAEKDQAMKKAQEFLKSKNYPSWTPISRVVEDAEPSTFKQYFTEWRESGDRGGLGRNRRSESSSD